ncbi:hypothetical protein [Hyphobacterium marinum]|uniref:Uncharacterized protein n=1 Tax=Hyphobacterium marinum TaxID=3116574 RepID=A0ABU7LYY3_9PROT|nr:hypothetical protein [Hyphobacterium sp. Y6023]MEE2566764.1 hypothetical protein [Hyphobacterium sp. Y6023]
MLSILAALLLQASGMQPLFDHGLQVSSDSVTYVVFFEEDGRYSTSVGIHGTWEIVDGELCTTRSTGEHNCQPLMMDGLETGSSWTGENAAGETVTFTLVPRE